MRVLQVVEPGFDGVFRHVEGLIDFLLAQPGIETALAYSSRRASARLAPFVERVREAGGPAIDLRVGNAPQRVDLLAWSEIRRITSVYRPQIIHAHSSKAGALVRSLGIANEVPLVYTPNAYFGMSGLKDVRSVFFNVVEEFLEPNACSIHVSPEEEEFARRQLHARGGMVQIPNAVDFDVFRPPHDMAERTQLRQMFGLPADAVVIGSIGRLAFQKHPECLYRAFAELVSSSASGSPYLLHVGRGEPSEESALWNLAGELGISNRVVRPEYRSDPELFFRAMDAFCLSSRYEGLPFTVLEALASNLPIILTDVPGLRSFGNPRYGFDHVYHAADSLSDSLAVAMKAWLIRRCEPVNHRARARGHFSVSVCYRRVLELYDHLLNGFRPKVI